MAKKKGRKNKRPIEQYDHADKTRANNPPVGLVSHETDKDDSATTYQYDPHIDPALQFDAQGAEVENIIDAGLSAANVETDDSEEVQAALKAAGESLAELKERRDCEILRSRNALRSTGNRQIKNPCNGTVHR